ncbi:MAG: site-specific integrase, partial [Micavibrio sp.]|nr:site-specific integrase [Micavibrio sp.]
MDGKVHVYKRGRSRFWQCSTYMNGRNHRVSSKEENIKLAIEFAREWYMAVYVNHKQTAHSQRIEKLVSHEALIGQAISAPSPFKNIRKPTKKKASGHTFEEAAKKFIAEYELSVAGQRNERYAKSHESRINNHLIPFFGNTPLKKITAGLVQEYRIKRTQNGFNGRFPSRSTLHHETVTLRMVLKTAH